MIWHTQHHTHLYMPRLGKGLYLHHANAEDPSKNQIPIMESVSDWPEKALIKCTQHKQTGKREECVKTLWEKLCLKDTDQYWWRQLQFCHDRGVYLYPYISASRVPLAQCCYFIFYTEHLTSTGLPILLFMYKYFVYKRLLCLNSALESRQRNVSRLLHVKPVSANGFTRRTQSSKKECAEISLHTSVPEL